MSAPAISVSPTTPIDEIVDLLVSNRVKRVPVVQNGTLTAGVAGVEDHLVVGDGRRAYLGTSIGERTRGQSARYVAARA